MISIALSVALIYLVFVSGATNTAGISKFKRLRIAGFVFACAITLTCTHLLLEMRWLLVAVLWLLLAGCASAFVYWKLIRANRSAADSRISYTMMVWGGSWLWSLFALAALWVGRERLKLETDASLSLDTVVQIASISITAVGVVYTYIMKSDQANRTAKQEIYQTLELQSIELFRFEANASELVAKLWVAKTPPENEAERYEVKQYICQMLNLFEMAYRFRTQGIMAPEVFGSWVIWIWELCAARVFQHFWQNKADDLPLNYIPQFRDVIDKGIALSKAGHTEARRKSFFNWLSREIECDEIGKWLAPRQKDTPSRVAD